MSEAGGQLPRRLGASVPWLLAIGAVVAVVALPLVSLALVGLEGAPDALVRSLGPSSIRAIGNTLMVGATVALASAGIGTAIALALERGTPVGRRWLRLALLLPLLTPPFVAALGWAQAYGPSALIDDLTGIELPGLFGPAGVIAVLVASAAPLVTVVVAAALATRVEPDLERAARVHGASGGSALRTVTVPLLRPAILAGGFLAFVTAINAFGVPAVLGIQAGFGTITTRIYQDLALSAEPAALARVVVLACLLVVLAVAAVGIGSLLARGGPAVRTGGGAGGAPIEARGSRRLVLAFALGGYLLLTIVVPLVALGLMALTRAVGLAPSPENWTLDNFRTAFQGPTLRALANSVVLAAAAALIAVALGGVLVALRRRRTGRSLGLAAALTFAVPGSALAVGVLLAYGGWLRDTLLLILVAYVSKMWALGHRPLAGAADRLPSELVLAARASGAGPLAALRTVTVPLLRPAIAAGWLLVFLFALHEVTMSSLLYGPGSETLAVVVLNRQQLGDPTVTAALALLLTGVVLLAAAPLVLLRRSAVGVMGWE